MSAEPLQPTDGPIRARVLAVGDLPVSDVQRYAQDAGEVYFERRGGRTFLVSDR